MKRLLWLIMNLGLLAVAYAVTTWVLEQRPALDTGNEMADKAEHPGNEKRPAKAKSASTSREEPRKKTDLSVLWRETLFRPERTEDLEIQAAKEVEEATKTPFSLELTGLARIGDRSVAVIVQHRATVRRSPRATVHPTSRGMRRPRSGVSPPVNKNSAAPSGPPDRHVYKVGDKVGDSGYTVKAIHLDDEEVVLTRGKEERIISLDKSDDQSVSRLKNAATAEEAKKKALAAKEKARQLVTAAKVAPRGKRVPGAAPPPPPPVPGGGPRTRSGGGRTVMTANPATMTREERLKRARLLRERILQRRAASSKDEQGQR